jgi:hypothetical protein
MSTKNPYFPTKTLREEKIDGHYEKVKVMDPHFYFVDKNEPGPKEGVVVSFDELD